MAASGHIIHRQLIDIRVSDKAGAQHWQNEISVYYKNIILPALEKVCDELCPGGDHIRMSKLELDLGNVRHDTLRPELTRELVKQFREEILKVASEKLYLVKHGGAKTALPEGVAAMSARSGSLYDTVMYYLEYGLLPWWSSSRQFSIRRAMDELLAERGEQFLESLRQLLYKKPFQQRIIDICSEKQLMQCLDPKGKYRLKILFRDFKRIAKGKQQKHIFFRNILQSSVPATSAMTGKILPFDQEAAVLNMLKDIGYQFDQTPALLREVSLKAGPGSSKKKAIQNSADSAVQDEAFSGEKPKMKAKDGFGKQTMKNTVQQKSHAGERTPFPLQAEESIEIANAGAVLLWPYLQMFYKELGLVESTTFIDENARQRAVQLLHCLVNGHEEAEEHEWALFKLLCGMELSDLVPTTFEISDRETQECNNMLKAVIRNWAVLKNTSPEGLQKSFLRRSGLLKQDHNGWIVHIERIAIDVLIDRLTWPISVVRLAWNTNAIHVRW